MSDYIIAAKGTERLGEPSAVADLLKSWSTHPIEKLRPNKYDFGEPLRRPFDAQACHVAVAEWFESGRAVMLGRTRKPKFLVDLEWRKELGKDSRMFPWGCVLWLDRSAGDAGAEALLNFLIEKLDPVFAYTTTEDDEKEKHFIRYKDRVGIIEKYVGLEVGDLLPGVYWRTYLGKWAEEKVGGKNAIERLKCDVTRMQNGIMIEPFESSEAAGSEDASAKETAVISSLGRELFFDKVGFDPVAMEVDDQTASAIEQAIAARKNNA